MRSFLCCSTGLNVFSANDFFLVSPQYEGALRSCLFAAIRLVVMCNSVNISENPLSRKLAKLFKYFFCFLVVIWVGL